MAKYDPVARHPIEGIPYEKIAFIRLAPDRSPFYTVEGQKQTMGAVKALKAAFRSFGGECFYCGTKFKPQKLGPAHIDHVVPSSAGGSNRLHNLVIACRACGTDKADKPVTQFSSEVGNKYLGALERHLAHALGCAVVKSPAPLRPAPA